MLAHHGALFAGIGPGVRLLAEGEPDAHADSDVLVALEHVEPAPRTGEIGRAEQEPENLQI